MIYGLQLDMSSGLIKISTSTNPLSRISIQVHEAVLFVVQGDEHTEAVAYALLSPFRVGASERFAVPDKILVALRNLGQHRGDVPESQRPVPIPGFDF